MLTFAPMNRQSCIRVFADEAQINECRAKIKLVSPSLLNLAKVLDLASNDVRLKILYLLEEEGELCPCDISDILRMSIPAISQHLRKLKDGNIIQSRRNAQTIYYSLTIEHMKVLKPFFAYINQAKLAAEVI
jgi:DNA-binding transcriptional ArsR family regulator